MSRSAEQVSEYLDVHSGDVVESSIHSEVGYNEIWFIAQERGHTYPECIWLGTPLMLRSVWGVGNTAFSIDKRYARIIHRASDLSDSGG